MRAMTSKAGLVMVLVLMLFALPRLPLQSDGMAQIFAVSWLFCGVLVLSAHLYQVIWISEQARERERQRKQMLQWRRRQKTQQSHKRRKVLRQL